MRIRHAAIAGATLFALAVGLPALGDVIPIYHATWHAAGGAYATVEGGCGRVEAPGPALGQTSFYTFCFGSSVSVHSAPPSGSVERVNLWIHRRTCPSAGGECQQPESWGEPDVTYSVDPLLGTASVPATGGTSTGCGTVSLTLTAGDEPSLRAESGGFDSHADDAPGTGRGDESVLVRTSAGSVGRDATVNGTLCGAAIDTSPDDYFRARIFRGLGTEGAEIHILYG